MNIVKNISKLNKTLEGSKKFFSTPPEEIESRIKRFFITLKWLIYFTIRKFSRDFWIERAASLSYVTIISMIPLMVLFFSVVSVLGMYQEIITYIHNSFLPFVAPEFQDELMGIINDYISPTAFTGQKSGLINLLAIIGLILSATGVLLTAERVFNSIWRVRESRSYFQKITAFWVILTTSPFLILASVWLADYFKPTDEWVTELSKNIFFFRNFYDQLVPLVVSFFAFTLLLIFIPSVRVKFKSAAIGGLFSALLWELSKKGFYLYVLNVGTVTNFYKQIATIPLFLFWVFLTWIIILLGAELSYTYQNLNVIMREHNEKKTGKNYSQTFLAVSLLFSIVHAFKQGKTIPDLEEIADIIGIRVEELDNISLTLAEQGVLVEDASHRGRFTLTKSPENLNLADIVMSIRSTEFPVESSLGLSPIKPLSKEDRSNIQKKVEHIFAHAEKEYFTVFKKQFSIEDCFQN